MTLALLGSTARPVASAGADGLARSMYFAAMPKIGTNVNVIFRGQSNAGLFQFTGGAATVAKNVERLLGFNGQTDTIRILGGPGQTEWSGTSFIPAAWVRPSLTWLGGSAATGWTDGALEIQFAAYMNGLPASVKSSPTVTVWMHNENDSMNLGVTQAAWQSAIRYSVAEERAALNQGPATTPVDFVYVPFDFSPGFLQYFWRSEHVQAMKAGFETLVADMKFNAVIGAEIGDSNMDGPPGNAGPFGAQHLDQGDIDQLVARISVAIANQLYKYALAGSPETRTNGRSGWMGPRVISATVVAANQLSLSFAFFDSGTTFKALTAGAAQGAGWSVVENINTVVYASSAKLVGGKLVVTFTSKVPTDANARLYYGYGTGRIYPHISGPTSSDTREPSGENTAVYDTNSFPAWVSAGGVVIG